MKKLKLVFTLGAGLLGMVVPLSAHHSFQAEYDDQKPITLTGKVTKISPDNPHGWIYLDVKNEKGRVINWALELPPPNVLQHNGFDTSVYKAMEENHEEITVTHSRRRMAASMPGPQVLRAAMARPLLPWAAFPLNPTVRNPMAIAKSSSNRNRLSWRSGRAGRHVSGRCTASHKIPEHVKPEIRTLAASGPTAYAPFNFQEPHIPERQRHLIFAAITLRRKTGEWP